MAFIKAVGFNFPYLRLKRERIGQAWNQRSAPGEKAVAALDQDSLTMGVDAASEVLDPSDNCDIGGVYFASTSPPYKLQSAASLVVGALGLSHNCFTADFGNSYKAGVSALIAANDAIEAGRISNALVIVSDNRAAKPATQDETLFGDGAVGILLGEKGGLRLATSVHKTSTLIDRWQREEDRFENAWEDRFVKTEGVQKDISNAILKLLEKSQLSPKDISYLSFPGIDFRTPSVIAKKTGFDSDTQLANSLLPSIGFCGVAAPFVSLISALTKTNSGDRIILAGYGDGCDAILLEAEDDGNSILKGAPLKDQLDNKLEISYVDYLRHKKLLENMITDLPTVFSSSPQIFREGKVLMEFNALRCRQCDTVQYGASRICYECKAKDDFETVPLAQKDGKVITYTKDNLFQGGNPPQILAVIETDTKCRLYLQMTDCDPDSVLLGMKVSFTFRMVHDGSGFHNYFWKCKPVFAGQKKGNASVD